MVGRPRGRPRTEPVEVQRRRIVDAARAAFVDLGYDDATVAGIAQAADVPRAVVYDLVGDKASVFAAVADEVAAEVVAAMDEHLGAEVDEPATIDDLVRSEVHWFLRALSADPAIRAMLTISGRLGGVVPAVARTRRRIEDALTDIHVRTAARYGIDRGPGARLVSVMVLSLVEAIVVRGDLDDSWPFDATADVVAAFVAGGYLQVEGAEVATLDAFDRRAATDR